jgi:hypothetical protein
MRYQRVFTQLWTDKKFLSLSPEGQRLFFYMLTSPHSSLIGIYHYKPGYVCEDMNISRKDFERLTEEVEATDIVKVDHANGLIFLRNYLKHNSLQNHNQVKSAMEFLDTLEDTPLFVELYTVIEQLDKPLLKPLLERLRERLGQRFTKPLDKPLRNHSESESESVSESVGGVQGGKAARPSKKAPASFEVTDEMRTWAVEQDLPPELVDGETDKFRDHTFATARTDWLGTWKNWIRKAVEFRGGPAGFEHKPSWCVGKSCGDFKKTNSEGACNTTCTAKPKETVYA